MMGSSAYIVKPVLFVEANTSDMRMYAERVYHTTSHL